MMTLTSSETIGGMDKRVTDVRLDRIEAKIDRMSEALADIVRVEERLSASNDQVRELQAKVATLHERLNTLTQEASDKAIQAAANSARGAIVERILWVMFAMLLGGDNLMLKLQSVFGG